MGSRERELAEAARRQLGPFTHQQAVDAGFTPATIGRRVRSGSWTSLSRGVYLVSAAQPPGASQLLSAALLAGGPEAVVSHRSAAHLLGLFTDAPAPEITLPPGRKLRADVIVHRAELLRSDIGHLDGLRLTVPARTLVDCAAVLSHRVMGDLLDHALRTHLVTWWSLAEKASAMQRRGRRGPRMVLELLQERRPGDDKAESIWEARVLRLLRKAGLPEPVLQHPVIVGGRRYRLDFAWPDQKVALEFDGHSTHSSLAAFTDDRIRGNALALEGWTVFHLTARAVEELGIGALKELAAALQTRPRVVSSQMRAETTRGRGKVRRQ